MPAPAAILALIPPEREYPAGYPPIKTHEVIELPTAEVLADWGEDIARKFLWERQWHIERMAADPYHYGHINPSWRMVDEALDNGTDTVVILGGNRSSKSRYAARRVMRTLVERPGTRAWCFQTTDPNSVEMQQPYIWDYIPDEWRNVKKGRITDISYRRKTGFSEGTFILPNESQCWFRNYAQEMDTIEGGELDIIWFDELVPLDWVETAKYRLITRRGKMLITFTPIEGYSATVKHFLQGAKTIRHTEADLLPLVPGRPEMGFEKVPLAQQCAVGNTKIFYFHTKDNPFSGYQQMRATLAGAQRAEILCRAYGVPTKAIANLFPMFDEKVHVIPAEKIPAGGTWYMGCDPCNGRNFFMLWAVVMPNDQIIIAREWPQADDYIEGIGMPGAWAEPDGKLADGKRGPAQKPFGFGLVRYAEEIRRVERDIARRIAGYIDPNQSPPAPIEVMERWMDSRFGNTPTLQRDGGTTLIEQMADTGIDFTPAPGENQQEGFDLINNALWYRKGEPISATNQPRLLVADSCKNLIFLLQEYTGQDGKHGASKDPIDVLRYLLLAGMDYIPPGGGKIFSGGSY